jgi:hypothetical protein
MDREEVFCPESLERIERAGGSEMNVASIFVVLTDL